LAENIFDKGIGATDVEIPGGDSPVLMLERTRSFFKVSGGCCVKVR